MWKESYRVGIESIDSQHIALFGMVDNLLGAIASGAEKEAFREAIEFLKNYVVRHFRDEEVYQASIHYSGMENHKKAHHDFTYAVLDYERKLIDTDYDLRVLKDLAGTLTAWLIYHVADADQRIAKGDIKAVENGRHSYLESFSASTQDVLEKMAGLDLAEMTESKAGEKGLRGDILVEVGLIGDMEGSAVFSFSRELAFKLIESMTFTQPEEVDEFVCSALAELANISSGNAATELSDKGIRCDIKPPIVSVDRGESAAGLDAVTIDTAIGTLGVGVRPD